MENREKIKGKRQKIKVTKQQPSVVSNQQSALKLSLEEGMRHAVLCDAEMLDRRHPLITHNSSLISDNYLNVFTKLSNLKQ